MKQVVFSCCQNRRVCLRTKTIDDRRQMACYSVISIICLVSRTVVGAVVRERTE